MTENENWRYQISYKIGGAMVNIRAQEEREWVNAIQSFDAMAENVVESVRKVDALFLPSGNTGGQAAPQVSRPAAQPSYGGGGATTSAGEAPICRHGAMTARSGVSAKTGKPWSAWMCPAPKGTPDQCEAIWNR